MESDGWHFAYLVDTPKVVRIQSIAYLNGVRERSCQAGEMANARLCGTNLGKFEKPQIKEGKEATEAGIRVRASKISSQITSALLGLSREFGFYLEIRKPRGGFEQRCNDDLI